MNQRYALRFRSLLLPLCLMVGVAAPIGAQLTVERDLLSPVGPAVVIGSPVAQQLQVTCSLGETLIGYAEGDIILTVGFQQTELGEDDTPGLEAPNEEVIAGADAVIEVTTYPNPTVEEVTIDLGKHRDQFTEIQLVDPYGRVVRSRPVQDGQDQLRINRLAELPNANYFLMALDKKGRIHQLSTVMIVTY